MAEKRPLMAYRKGQEEETFLMNMEAKIEELEFMAENCTKVRCSIRNNPLRNHATSVSDLCLAHKNGATQVLQLYRNSEGGSSVHKPWPA